MLALADLEDFDEYKVKEHLSREYSGKGTYENGTDEEVKETLKTLSFFNVLVAYESVGSWGCDSSSYFLLKSKDTGDLFEIHGAHCSCYGFEGQFDLEPTSTQVLKAKVLGSGNVFYCGGYDEQETENQKLVNDFIMKLN